MDKSIIGPRFSEAKKLGSWLATRNDERKGDCFVPRNDDKERVLK